MAQNLRGEWVGAAFQVAACFCSAARSDFTDALRGGQLAARGKRCFRRDAGKRRLAA